MLKSDISCDPQRPRGTESLSEEQLAAGDTRFMVGTGLAKQRELK